MGKKVIAWTDEADARLLVGILEICKPKIDYEALAKWMGEGVTVSAVSHRIRRIKDKAKESTGSGVDGNTIAEPAVKSPATPAKRKRSRKTDEAASKKAKAGDDEVEDL